MKWNSKAIYGCKEAPAEFVAPAGTLLTYDPAARRLYVHLMSYPSGGLTLAGYKGKLRYAQFLHDDSELKFSPVAEGSNDLVLKLPAKKPNMEVPVVELVLE
jgi:alpha-L-fucosidase